MDDGIGMLIKQQRIALGLTARELADKSGISPSHLTRVERGQRFPSARILLKIAQPLGFQEEAILVYAKYLSPRSPNEAASVPLARIDPYVARVLSQEPVEMQRIVLAILTILKSLAKP